MKDRHATTRQWLSVPARATGDGAGGGDRGLRVLEAKRHGNKLRMGHLKGNRFEVVLSELGHGREEALRERLLALGREGLPNRSAEQRFGAAGDNVEIALAVLRGEAARAGPPQARAAAVGAAVGGVQPRPGAARRQRRALRACARATCCRRPASGGLFVTDDLARDGRGWPRARWCPPGPCRATARCEPPPGHARRAPWRDEALAAVGVTREELAAVGRDLPGARRPVVVPVDLGEPPVAWSPGGSAPSAFGLPPGSYATVVLNEIALEPSIRRTRRRRACADVRAPACVNFARALCVALGTCASPNASRLHSARVRLGAVAADRAVGPVGRGDGRARDLACRAAAPDFDEISAQGARDR